MSTSGPSKFNQRIVRRPRLRDYRPSIHKLRTRGPVRRFFATPLLLLYGFVALIGAGGLLLWLPVASVSGEFTPWYDALFTATSAVTVTGLTVLDTPSHWSSFGQGVIFTLMLLGGIGFMTFATFLLVLIGQRISISERMLIRDTLGGDRIGGVVRLLQRVVLVVMGIYAVGMLLIFWQMSGVFPSTGEALWQSAFLSVSSFNNAGFTIVPNSESLAGLNNKFPLLIFVGGLIVLGGIGWTVIVDVYRRRRFSRLSLDTKMILTTSVILWVVATLVFFFSEVGNQGTIASFSVPGKVGASVFEAISSRTAGFTNIEFTNVTEQTKLFFIFQMFVGGAAGSTAGGIKVGTLAVVVAAVVSSIRGREHPEAFGRELPQAIVYKAITVIFLAGVIIFGAAMLLELTEGDGNIPFLNLFFETVSAMGTTGLSVGVAPMLTPWGKMIMMALMLLGRLGPLALALALTPKKEGTVYRYAEEGIRIG